jgi:hypothetical protein
MQQHLQITYLPYLFMAERAAMAIGPATIWNFNREKGTRIPNEALREYVTRLLEANVYLDKPIRGIAVLSLRGHGAFLPATRTDVRLIEETRLLLFLCSVSASNIYSGENAGHYMVTAENFTVTYQNFQPGNRWTGYSSGRIVTIRGGGYEVGKVHYEKPPYVLANGASLDDELLAGLNRVKRRNRRQYRRILRATDAFMNGYYNSPDVSREARVLQQARAFEILFELPDRDQRKEFKVRVAKFCPCRDRRQFRYLSERAAGGRHAWETGTRPVYWADRFYTLRNHIIHGDNVKPGEFVHGRQNHEDLALWFFLLSVKYVINDILRQRLFYDELRWESSRLQYHPNRWHRSLERAVEKALKRPKAEQARALAKAVFT